MIDVILAAGRDRSIRRRHPWVLSGAVSALGGPEPAPGEWVRVRAAEGEVLGFGHWSPKSTLRVRLLRFGKEDPGEESCLREAVLAALRRREQDPLLGGTNARRLVNAEGDALPGLVVDRYGDTVVARFGSAGMHARRQLLGEILREATGAACGFERPDPQAARREGLPAEAGPLFGSEPKQRVEIQERERSFEVDVVNGQKTGFYLDQREARDLVTRLARGRRVLDLFSYSGGFAVAAARGGATQVTLVDSSAPALEQARSHLERNAPECPASFERSDAFRWLRADPGPFDLVIADPPPLARHRGDVPRATRAYKDLFLHALRRLEPGGLALCFCCSHHVGPELFRKVVFGASLDARRSVQVVAELAAPSDHPVSIDHPEGAYLKGLLLRLA